MRTNIDIDDALLAKAMAISGSKTKKAAVDEALRTFVRHESQYRALQKLKGIGWDGDLDEMRAVRFADKEPW